eukprot:6190885-Pleurochrysis_carterae.AAC.3
MLFCTTYLKVGAALAVRARASAERRHRLSLTTHRVPTWAVSWISNAPTDDDFWEPPTAREPKRPKGGPAAGDGAAVDEDDSDGLDVLDGLIG